MSTTTTPLRRSASLRHSQSGQLNGHNDLDATLNQNIPLDALQALVSEFADEMDTLTTNVTRLDALDADLARFNQSFGCFLYALSLDAYCLEWTNAPTELSWARLGQLEEPQAPSQEPVYQPNLADQTYQTVDEEDERATSKARTSLRQMHDLANTLRESKDRGPMKKTLAASGPTPAPHRASMTTKKRRDQLISSIVDTLPLEWRGQSAVNSQMMASCLNALLNHTHAQATMESLTSADLKRVQVNKCLMALVAAKKVDKIVTPQGTVYRLLGATV